MPKVSVIIPTYNRRRTLRTVLDSLFEQTYSPSSYEVIVVDDGGTDGTAAYIRDRCAPGDVSFVLLRQEQKGPAAARNLAIRRAAGDILILLNDDVIPEENLLEAHSTAHQRLGALDGVAGRVVFPQGWKRTPLLEYIERVESRKHLCDGQKLNHRYFVTNNLSVKREILFQVGLFDETIKYPVGEDIDLGYRLEKVGFQLHYSRDAIGYHHHLFDCQRYAGRMRLHGRHAAIYSTIINPEYELRLHGSIFTQFLPLESLLRARDAGGALKWGLGKILSNAAAAWLLERIVAAEERTHFHAGLFTFYRLLFLHHFSIGFSDAVELHST